MKYAKISLALALLGFSTQILPDVNSDLDSLESLVQQAKAKFSNIKEQVQSGTLTAQEKERITAKVQALKDKFDAIREQIKTEITDRIQRAGETATSTGTDLTSKGSDFVNKAREAASGAIDRLRNLWS